jgi:class 3 adenylate cyclase
MRSHPPSGTVTFLFTDIECSLQFWQDHPGRMDLNLARHAAVLRKAIESNRGYVFKTIGDGFCAAFATAGEALQAAVAIQSSLSAEDWGEAPIRVRMGLHTGKAGIQADGDYSGYVSLSCVQRLMSAGHGGQTLLSQETRDLLQEELPDGVSLRDLGEHCLKDLNHPMHIYQVDIPGLPADFPALKTLEP